jgi:hypothetical protein
MFLLIGVLVAVVVVLAGAVGTIALRTGSPRQTADKFLTALKDKDVQRAHDLLCADGRRKKTADDLRGDFGLQNDTISSYVITSDTATQQRDNKKETLVEATLTYQSGRRVPVQIGVWTEGGGQRICSLLPPG